MQHAPQPVRQSTQAFSLPSGLNTSINWGNSSNAPITAANMASTLNSPNYMLGLKFDSVSIEKTTMTVTVV